MNPILARTGIPQPLKRSPWVETLLDGIRRNVQAEPDTGRWFAVRLSLRVFGALSVAR